MVANTDRMITMIFIIFLQRYREKLSVRFNNVIAAQGLNLNWLQLLAIKKGQVKTRPCIFSKQNTL